MPEVLVLALAASGTALATGIDPLAFLGLLGLAILLTIVGAACFESRDLAA